MEQEISSTQTIFVAANVPCHATGNPNIKYVSKNAVTTNTLFTQIQNNSSTR
jgi:hypothetical protein